jgi:hypothetical protein
VTRDGSPGVQSGNMVWLVLAGALLWRLALIPATHAGGYTSDEKEYIRIATGLVEGSGFVDSNGDRAVRAPLFPGVLSLLARLPSWIWIGHLLGALLGTLVVYLGYLVAREMTHDERGALFAAAILAVHPGLAIYAGLLQTETLYTVLLLGSMLAAARLPEDPGIVRGALAGVLGGLAGLTRAVAAGFFPLMLVAIWWAGRGGRRRLIPSLCTAAVCWCAVLAPWTIRNALLFDALVPISSGGGSSLLLGNNPFASGGLRVGPGFEQWYGEQLRRNGGTGTNEVERSAVDGRIAKQYISEEPLRSLGLSVKKSQIFWVYPAVHTDSDVRVQLPAVATDLAVWLAVAVGLVVLRPPRSTAILVAVAILYFWLVQAVLHAEARFRLPVVPLLAAYAGAGVAALARPRELLSLLRGSGRAAAMAALLLVVLLVYGVTAWMVLSGQV